MNKKVKLSAASGVLAMSLFLGGCSLVAKQADVATETPTVTLTGTLTSTGNTFFVSEGTKNTEVTSRKIDLSQYVGKQVTVTGEFSGTTLFIDVLK